MNIEPDTGQDVFIIPEGAAGALAELERRKFTAEEGVGHLNSFFESQDDQPFSNFPGSSHTSKW